MEIQFPSPPRLQKTLHGLEEGRRSKDGKGGGVSRRDWSIPSTTRTRSGWLTEAGLGLHRGRSLFEGTLAFAFTEDTQAFSATSGEGHCH